ncbi:MAG TPA: MoaD/ThiS family protein [Polyangiaceae bacterium]|jgi:molybdopterin converting factor small subunit|nr:MoaD/ThiS family protein [Polyangiaceae bacterium]
MKVRFSGTLLRAVDYEREIELDAPTLGVAFDQLLQRFPQLRTPLLDDGGAVRSIHRLFLNREQLEPDTDLAAMNIGARDTLDVITALAGG